MECEEHDERLNAIYEHLWSAHDGEPYARLDQSLNPRPPGMLFDLFEALKGFGVVAKWERRWSCKPVIAGSIPVNSIFQDVGQWLPTCLGSKLTQVRILPS